MCAATASARRRSETMSRTVSRLDWHRRDHPLVDVEVRRLALGKGRAETAWTWTRSKIASRLASIAGHSPARSGREGEGEVRLSASRKTISQRVSARTEQRTADRAKSRGAKVR